MFIRKIPLSSDRPWGGFDLIDSTVIALRQIMTHRYSPDCRVISFIDYNGKETKAYPSHLYPLPKHKFKRLGSPQSYLWRHNDKCYYLEVGADTIFRIKKDSLIPSSVLSGKYKINDIDEHFIRKMRNDKLDLLSVILRPNSGIFESDRFMIFRLMSMKELFFMVYNKTTKQFHRTFYKNAKKTRSGIMLMDYFTDNIISGLPFNPKYQSHGKALALFPALDICERKQEILDFISSHPSEEAAKLKALVQNIKETDNPIVMIVKFK